MKTVTRKRKSKRKSSSGKPRRRPKASAKPSRNGHAKTAPASADKFDPNQKPLSGMEDVDERIPELEDECQRYFAGADKILSGREDREAALDKIGKLLHEHKMDCYIKNGRKFFFEPSKETVKVKKVKQNG